MLLLYSWHSASSSRRTSLVAAHAHGASPGVRLPVIAPSDDTWRGPTALATHMWPARDRRPAWGCPQDFLTSGALAGLARAQPQLRRGDGLCAASPQEAALSVGPPPSLAVPSRLVSFGKDVAAGTVAGMAVVCVGHPFDTLKVLLQTQPCDKPLYTGVVDAFKKTVASEGLGGLYKGVTAPLAGQMFFRAALFFSVARTKELFEAGPQNLLGYALAGSAAWGVASLAESPIDFYKSQLQKQLIQARITPGMTPKYANMLDCLRQSVAANGVFGGPLQGFSATLLRNIPAAGVYFGTFETLKLKLPPLTGDASPKLAHLFVAGGSAGFMYWLLFYPLDVIKSALQTDALVKMDRKYSGIGDAVKQLYAEGGIGRFYKGLTPCLIRSVPANAVMLITNTKVRAMLD